MADEEKPFNAGDPRSVKEKSKADKLQRRRELEDLKSVLETVQGRRYLQRLLADCGIFRSSFHPSSQIYYNEGIRSVGVKIWGEIEECSPELLILMLKEHAGHSNQE